MNSPKKEFGQHWLVDDSSLEAIITEASMQPNDHVIEIGPGHGALTRLLLEAGSRVTAIEYDAECVAFLKKQKWAKDAITNKSLTLLQEDIRSYQYDKISGKYKIVANIPYYLTSYLMRQLSETTHKPQRAVLLVQKEVAERVAEQPGNMSILAVIMQSQFTTSLGAVVSAEKFDPVPKVDSQILIIVPKEDALNSAGEQWQIFTRVVKFGFSERRKKLRSSLKAGFSMTSPELDEFLKINGLSGDMRAQELTLDSWLKLSHAYTNRQKL